MHLAIQVGVMVKRLSISCVSESSTFYANGEKKISNFLNLVKSGVSTFIAVFFFN